MVWSERERKRERERGHMGSRECEMGSRVRMVPERPMNSPNAIFGIQLSIVKVFFFLRSNLPLSLCQWQLLMLQRLRPYDIDMSKEKNAISHKKI